MSEVITIPQRIEADEFADKLVREALSWKGTPFAHQGKLKGLGVDCANFIDQVFRAVGVNTECIQNNYRPEQDGSLMLSLLEERLLYVPTDNRSPADVIAFCDVNIKNPDRAKHLAFVTYRTNTTTFVMETGINGAVHHRLNGWWNRRIHSVWRHPR